jgi:hypothetical protein
LTNPTKLFDFLEKDSIPAIRDMGKRWSSTFGALGALQKMTKSRHIDDPKQFVVDWRTAATHFFDLQKRYFPNRTTTPKMHQLKGTALTFPSNVSLVSVHVPDFVMEHGEMGLFTEQAIEHYHVVHRRAETLHNSIKDAKSKRELVFRQLVTISVWHRRERIDPYYFDEDREDDQGTD